MSYPDINTQPAAMTAVELVSAYAAGTLSPVEATEAILEAIAARDGEVNAYCLVDSDRALVQAKDSRRAGIRVTPADCSTVCRFRSRTFS